MDEKIKFLLAIDTVFNIRGQGIVVTERVIKDQIKQYADLEITSPDKVIKTKCLKLEKYMRAITEAHEGEYIGITLADVTKSEISKGMQLIIR